ncbi:MAG: N-acyl homoserine lactonase family protein [Alphaproteobacteria bacterium]|nr:N-acyl homoserine lactonase family protein [Alphaproteobacteria bacterium]
MHILSGGRVQMKKHVYVPHAAREEIIELPVSCFLFRHPHGTVLFDTGCHPSVAGNPEKRWGKMARAVVPTMGADDNVVRELRRLNLSPADIDIVVNSHLHCDHCGCNEFFSTATIYVHASELAVARDADSEGKGYFQADWKHPMPITEIDGEVDLFDDGRIVLLPLPGHTPGLTGLLASLPNSGAYLLASDAVAIRENLALETIPKNTWNPELHAKSVAKIKQIEKSGTTVVFGHDLAQWSGFNSAEECYD